MSHDIYEGTISRIPAPGVQNLAVGALFHPLLLGIPIRAKVQLVPIDNNISNKVEFPPHSIIRVSIEDSSQRMCCKILLAPTIIS